MEDSSVSKDEKFVDIHGHDILTLTIGRNNKLFCSLSNLQQMGVAIYRKSQYANLATIKPEFDNNFVQHMLESAKTYMVNNQIRIDEKDIMNSIEKCKRLLTDGASARQRDFFKERQVEATSDNEIRICVTGTSSSVWSPPGKKTAPYQSKFRQKAINDHYTQSNEKKLNDSHPESTENSLHKNDFDRQTTSCPKLRLPQKKILYNIDQDECEVLVTHIDKTNVCWVREKANAQELETIHKKVNQEAKNQKPVPQQNLEMDTVYMAEDEDVWFRCKVVRFRPLTVIFLDYGNIAEVQEVKEISEELASLPALAIRITFKDPEYIPHLEDEIRIKRFMKNPDGTFFVNILRRNENITTSGTSEEIPVLTDQFHHLKTKASTSCNNPHVDVAFFKKPLPLSTLENNQKVVIAHEKDGVFYLRTQACYQKLKDIESEINIYLNEAKTIRSVKDDQLVLYKKDTDTDGKFYRAVVLQINKNMAEIECLDYVETVQVEVRVLKTINEKLSKEPVTFFIGGKLLGFEDKQLNEKCRQIVEQYIKTKKKFIVSLGFEEELDLFDGVKLLSEEFEKLSQLPKKLITFKDNGSRKMFLKDIQTYKPKFGFESYLIGSYKNMKELTIVPLAELQEHIDYILRTEIEDTEMYTPEVGEVCLCYHIDHWYRCVVTRIIDTEYEVLLLDFGNVEFVSEKNFRRGDIHITELAALALPCILMNVPEHHNIENLLKSLIKVGSIYNVDVTDIKNGKCHVKLPSVYEEIGL